MHSYHAHSSLKILTLSVSVFILISSCNHCRADETMLRPNIMSGGSITVTEGCLIELNCSDLVYAGMISEEDYIHESDLYEDSLTGTKMGESDPLADALERLLDEYGKDMPFDDPLPDLPAALPSSAVSALDAAKTGNRADGEKLTKKREAIVTKDQLDQFLNETDDTASDFSSDIDSSFEDVTALQKIESDAVSYVRYLSYLHALSKYPSDVLNLLLNALASLSGKSDQYQKLEKGGIYFEDYPGYYIDSMDGRLQIGENGALLEDEYGNIHKMKNGYVPVDIADITMENYDVSESLAPFDSYGSAVSYDSFGTPWCTCPHCHSRFTYGIPCKCGTDEYPGWPPLELSPSILTYDENGSSSYRLYFSTDDYTSFSIDNDLFEGASNLIADLAFGQSRMVNVNDDRLSEIREQIKGAEKISSAVCMICGLKMDPSEIFTGAMMHICQTPSGSYGCICNKCYASMNVTYYAEEKMLDQANVTADNGILKTGFKVTYTASDGTGKEISVSQDDLGKVINGTVDPKSGKFVSYVSDGNCTQAFQVIAKYSDLAKGNPTGRVKGGYNELMALLGALKSAPDPDDLLLPNPDNDESIKNAQELMRDILKIQQENPAYTDTDTLRSPGTLTKADQLILDHLSNPNGRADTNNPAFENAKRAFLQKVEDSGMTLSDLVKIGVITPSLSSSLDMDDPTQSAGGSTGLSYPELLSILKNLPSESYDDIIYRLSQYVNSDSAPLSERLKDLLLNQNEKKSDTFYIVQAIEKEKTESHDQNVKAVITAFHMTLTDNRTGEIIERADDWNGGSLFWTAACNGNAGYTVNRWGTGVNVASIANTRQVVYRIIDQKTGNVLEETSVTDTEDSTTKYLDDTASAFTHTLKINVKKSKSSVSVNGRTFPTERLW